jgi:hypothetical protein
MAVPASKGRYNQPRRHATLGRLAPAASQRAAIVVTEPSARRHPAVSMVSTRPPTPVALTKLSLASSGKERAS